MKKTLLALGATLSLLVSAAVAQPAPGGMPPPPDSHMDHMGLMGPKGSMPKEITREQFLQRAAQHFDQVDTNHDGKLDRSEMRAAHEKMRAKRDALRERRGERAENASR